MIELRDLRVGYAGTDVLRGASLSIGPGKALAQDAGTVLMDEPTTFLDVGHQLEVMRITRRLAQEGKAVVLVLHDLCLTLRGADEIALLEGGRLVEHGTPEKVYSSGALDKVFGITLRRVETENGWQYYYG